MDHTINILSQPSTWVAIAVIIGCIPAIVANPYSMTAWGALFAAVVAVIKHTPLATPPPAHIATP